MKELLHVDLITIAIVIGGFIGTWYTLRADSKWHTAWIKKHSEECDKRETQITNILLEMRTSNAQLSTLVTGHHESIQRIDGEVLRVRERVHDLAHDIQKSK